MGFYYALEQKKFNQAWEEMKEKYTEAGMDETAINKIKEFDWQWFRSQRTYVNHTQSFPEPITSEMPDDEKSTLLQKFNSLYTELDVSQAHRHAWIETISDPRLSRAVKLLPEKDIELLTLLVIEGHSQEEIARKWGCSQKAVSKKFEKIKKVLK